MKSKTLNNIKYFERLCTLLSIYYLAYNSYFGWNIKAKSYNEEVCDLIAQIIYGLCIIMFILSITSFMKLVVYYIKSKTINE